MKDEITLSKTKLLSDRAKEQLMKLNLSSFRDVVKLGTNNLRVLKSIDSSVIAEIEELFANPESKQKTVIAISKKYKPNSEQNKKAREIENDFIKRLNNKYLDSEWSNFDISARNQNALANCNIQTVNNLLQYGLYKYMKQSNVGVGSVNELINILESLCDDKHGLLKFDNAKDILNYILNLLDAKSQEIIKLLTPV